MPKHAVPFAVSEAELHEVEEFCARNGLDQIGRICAELRVLRAEYLALEHNPAIRYSKELDAMIAMTKETKDASPVA